MIAQRYAQALFDMSQEHARLPVVYHDLQKINDLIGRSIDLKRFLNNPVIPAEKAQLVLKDIFHGKVDALTYKFLLFLQAKGRLRHLQAICAVFSDIYEETKHILRTKWTSSTDLSAKDVQGITDYLKTKFAKEIVVEQEVDPGILGGIKIRAGDTVYDYTLQSQLKRFQKTIMKA